MMNFKAKRAAVLLTAIALLLAAAVGGTIAYLTASTGEVVNTFTPTEVPIEVTESFNGKTKSLVAIKNTGNIPAFIRSQVIITWQDKNGNVHGQKPVEDVDYDIVWGTDYWLGEDKTDEIRYYQLQVEPEDNTNFLIVSCKPKEGRAPEGYDLHVEILAQSIQAMPVSVVEKAWNVETGEIKIDQGEKVTGILRVK